MSNQSDRQRLLKKLSRLVEELTEEFNGEEEPINVDDEGGEEDIPGCSIKSLPKNFQVAAAETAVELNPVNAPRVEALASLGIDGSLADPLSIAVMTTKYWGPSQRTLTVSFLEQTSVALRDRIIAHMNAWNKTAGISFAYTKRDGNIRITRAASGYWSYVGTDVLHISLDRPTMCLQSFSMNTPESEYRRVVRHETGHTLGFPHEHMRKELVAKLDKQKCYDYFLRTQGWNRQMVDAQVLTPLDQRSIFSTRHDDTSIMCYQLPGSITKDGKPIRGGNDINDTDYRFAGKIYPKTGSQTEAESVRTRNRSGDNETSIDDSENDLDTSSFLIEPLPLDS